MFTVGLVDFSDDIPLDGGYDDGRRDHIFGLSGFGTYFKLSRERIGLDVLGAWSIMSL